MSICIGMSYKVCMLFYAFAFVNNCLPYAICAGYGSTFTLPSGLFNIHFYDWIFYILHSTSEFCVKSNFVEITNFIIIHA